DLGLILTDRFFTGGEDRWQFLHIAQADAAVEFDLDEDDFVVMHLDREKHLAAFERLHRGAGVRVETIEKPLRFTGRALFEIERDNHVYIAFDRFHHWHR